MNAPALDHIGIVGADLDALEAAYHRLGFQIAPRCELLRLDEDGSSHPIGQSNCHVVFDETYIELTAVQGDLSQHHLRDAIARYFGLHIVVFLTDDAASAHHQLDAAGLAPDPVGQAAREIRYPSKQGMARFRWFRLPEDAAPEAFVCYVQHRDRDLVFDQALTTHPNGAEALREIHLCVEDLPAAVRRLERYLDEPLLHSGESACFSLPVGRIQVWSANGLLSRFPGLELPQMPWAAGFTVSTKDLAMSRRTLQDAGVTVYDGDQRFWIAPHQAGGAVVEFVPTD